MGDGVDLTGNQVSCRLHPADADLGEAGSSTSFPSSGEGSGGLRDGLVLWEEEAPARDMICFPKGLLDCSAGTRV